MEAGPAALPHVVKAYESQRDPHVRATLVRVVSEYRSPDACPFLEGALRVAEPDIWKAALDGLITLGSAAALDVLCRTVKVVSANQRGWIEKAIQQVQN